MSSRGDLGIAVAVAAAGLAFAAAPASAVSLRGDYGFNGTRGSSVGGPAMQDVGSGNAFATERVGGSSRRVLRFPKGNGLLVSTAGRIPRTRYSIVMRVRFNETSGYRRILDFSNGSSDAGLYVFSGTLRFFTHTSGSAVVIRPSANGNPYHEVMLTRASSGQVIGYVDGVEQLRFQDTGRATIHAGQSLRFFADDRVVPNEVSAGAVASIQLYDGPLPGPPPQLGESVGARQVRGTVRVRLPGGSAALAQAAGRGSAFVPLARVRRIPVGSLVDTSRGELLLTSAVNRRGRTQSGRFSGGVFKVTQSRRARARGLTDLSLTGGSFARCGRASAAGPLAVTSQRRRSRRTVRRLRGNARGRFRTRGRYSAATVRGTDWTTTDRCDGTLTSVRRGRVDVRDFKRRRTIRLRAGRRYLARASG
jgi:hypothetical protein